jgi:hypothetical protein
MSTGHETRWPIINQRAKGVEEVKFNLELHIQAGILTLTSTLGSFGMEV